MLDHRHPAIGAESACHEGGHLNRYWVGQLPSLYSYDCVCVCVCGMCVCERERDGWASAEFKACT